MAVLVWHLHMAPDMGETSPSFRTPQASAPPPAPSPPSQGTTAAGKAPLLQAPPQDRRGRTAAATRVDNIHSNSSSGNQTLLPARAGSEEQKCESRTSQLHISPIHAAFCWGDQNPRTEYGSKEEVVLRCSSSYFIRVAQNQ